MPKNKNPKKLDIDLEIERTLRSLRKEKRLEQLSDLDMSNPDPRTNVAGISQAQPDSTHSEPNPNIRFEINTDPNSLAWTEPFRDSEPLNTRNPRIRESLEFILQNSEIVTNPNEFFTNSRVQPPGNRGFSTWVQSTHTNQRNPNLRL